MKDYYETAFDRYETPFDKSQGSVAELDAHLDPMGARLDRIEAMLDQPGARFDRFEATMNAGFDRLEAQLDQLRRWIIIYTVWMTVLIGVLIYVAASCRYANNKTSWHWARALGGHAEGAPSTPAWEESQYVSRPLVLTPANPRQEAPASWRELGIRRGYNLDRIDKEVMRNDAHGMVQYGGRRGGPHGEEESP